MHRSPAVIVSSRSVAPTVIELTLERPDGSAFFNFQPGQYATLCFPAFPRLRGERSFSIASAPTDRTQLKFGIRIGGRYTSALRSLRVGDTAVVAGPFGDFIFDPVRDKAAVFIAGGIGITPFLSMARAATDLQLPNELILLYSVRSASDMAFAADLDQLEKNNPHFHAYVGVSDKKLPAGTGKYFSGRINAEAIDRAVQGMVWGRTYFICGPPAFMSAITSALKEMGLPASLIKTEKFGIGSSALLERGSMVPRIVFAAWGTAAALLFAVVAQVEMAKQPAVPLRQNAPVTSGSVSINAPLVNSAALPAVNAAPPPTIPTAPIVTPVPRPVKKAAPANSNSAPAPVTNAAPTAPAPQPAPVVVTPTAPPAPAPAPAPIIPRTTVS